VDLSTTIPILLAWLLACGCTEGYAVELAQTAHVTFPSAPDEQVSHELVSGHPVVVATATYVKSRSEHPHHRHGGPLVFSTCVVRFDASVFPALDEQQRVAFAADLRDAFGRFGGVTEPVVTEVAGLPGYEIVVDRTVLTPRWKNFPPQAVVRTLLRVAVGQTSLSVFAVSFALQEGGESTDASSALRRMTASSSLDDLAPSSIGNAAHDEQEMAGALTVLASKLDW